MNGSWPRRLPKQLEAIIELLIVCQDVQLESQLHDEQRLINNDAKLSLTLVEGECNQRLARHA